MMGNKPSILLTVKTIYLLQLYQNKPYQVKDTLAPSLLRTSHLGPHMLIPIYMGVNRCEDDECNPL